MDPLDVLRREARPLIASGFWTFDEVADAVWTEAAAAGADESAALLRSMWDARAAAQSAWTDTGDFGRLAATFAELEAEGILARMCFSCCRSCGWHEIADERDEGPSAQWAYTFFDQRDAYELGNGPATLYLAFGAFDGGESGPVGERIVDAARRHGLTVQWSGSGDGCVRVDCDDWRKPLPA